MCRARLAALLPTTAVICATCAAAALAADEPAAGAMTGDTVVVTARASPRPLSKTPGSIAVFTRHDFETRRLAGVSDAAILTPGVSATADSPWGGEISIRGLSRESVVMLVDGCRVNTATDLNGRFGLVNPLEIERIEVLKGPLSSLYGSGSMGGTVSIITRRGRFTEKPGFDATLDARYTMNPDGWEGFALGEGSDAGRYVMLSQGWRDHESYTDGDGYRVRNSQYEDYQTAVKAGFRLGARSVLAANVQHAEGREIGVPGAGTAPLPAAADVTFPKSSRTLVSVVHDYTPESGALSNSTLNVYRQVIVRRVRIDSFSAASPLLAVYPAADHATTGLKWTGGFGAGDHAVSAGIDAWERSITKSTRLKVMKNGTSATDQPLPEPRCLSGGLFAEDDIQLGDRWTVNAGGRFDVMRIENRANDVWPAGKENDTGWDAHAGATWKAADKLVMKGIAASGYRAASLEERYQYLELGGGVARWGNPELEPERSVFGEYSIAWLDDSFSISCSAYVNSLRDMIGEERVDASTIRNANVERARIHGMDADLRWLVSDAVELYGNIGRDVGRNTKLDEYLPYVAPVNGLAGLRLGEDDGAGGWLRLEAVFADRQDKVPPDVEPAEGWVRTDLGAGWDFKRHSSTHSIFVDVENLFDITYRDYMKTVRGSAYNESGRSVTFGYRSAF